MRTTSAGRVVLFGTALLVLAACSRIEETSVLPWLKVWTTTQLPILNLGGATTRSEYLVRVYGIWRALDEDGLSNPVVLDANTVFFLSSGTPKLIRRGDGRASLACGGQRPAASVPAGADFVDCVQASAGRAAAVATTLRFRRITASGRQLIDTTVSVEAPDRVFLRPMVAFYDEQGNAYFLTAKWDTIDADCAIVVVEDGGSRSIAGPSSMSRADCSEPARWAKVVGRRLELSDRTLRGRTGPRSS